MKCKICLTEARELFEGPILQKYRAKYYACPHCGFVQTEDPFWLAEAYTSPLSTTDIGLVGRNVGYCVFLKKFISIFCRSVGPFLDYGGGNGMLVRLMRDYGFDFRWLDRYATNAYAQGFEHQPGQRYKVLTAFEVFEHLVNPREELTAMAALSDTIVFSTELISTPPPSLDSWDYYSGFNGQHIAFYTPRALEILAREVGLRYRYVAGGLHLISKNPPARLLIRTLAAHRYSNLLMPLFYRPSLLPKDHRELVARVLATQSAGQSSP